jgi:hypothetical protein
MTSLSLTAGYTRSKKTFKEKSTHPTNDCNKKDKYKNGFGLLKLIQCDISLKTSETIIIVGAVATQKITLVRQVARG